MTIYIHQAREPRVFARCRVEFEWLGRRVAAESEDLSRRGVFVRTNDLLPIGSVTELLVQLPDGSRFHVIGRVVHLLAPVDARNLGRHVGMGFEFLDPPESESGNVLRAYLDALIEALTPPPIELPASTRVVVADPSPALLERIVVALRQVGFDVEALGDGAEAYAACVREPPNLLVCAAVMTGLDGWKLLRNMAANPRLASIPIVFTNDDPSDMTRLQAYRLGVRDYITKPFTEEELVIRLQRVAVSAPRGTAEAVMLRGTLGELTLATVLSLLDFERKSGILLIMHDSETARLFVASGAVVKVEANGPSPRERMMTILDWRSGSFEFFTCEVVGSDELGMKTQSLLLEHARIRDEARRDEAARDDEGQSLSAADHVIPDDDLF